MIQFKPVYSRHMGQQAPAAAAPSDVTVPAPVIETTTYTGVPGFLETVAVLGVSGAAAYTSIQAARKSTKKLPQVLGWVGGVGAALIGLLYLGTKTGVTKTVQLPQIKVTPA